MAQSKELFTFDTKFYDGLDKWVIFPKSEKDTTYALGFIYLDITAGFTFNFEGNLESKEGKLILHKQDNTSIIKHRLGRNTKNVTVLTDDQVKNLALSKQPDWLSFYKSDPDSLYYQIQLGSYYNSVGGSNRALTILSKAYEKEKKDKDLLFELSFAHNALKQYDKAIPILEKAVKTHNSNELLYKELLYAYMNSNLLDKAEKTYSDYLKKTISKKYQTEMAYNITYSYFIKKDKTKFEEWKKITYATTNNNSVYFKNIELMTNDWDKK